MAFTSPHKIILSAPAIPTSPRRAFHHRSESSVLKRSRLCATKNSKSIKANHKKRVSRRFTSNKSRPASPQPNQFESNYEESKANIQQQQQQQQAEIVDTKMEYLLQQFRDILSPLQSEIKSLRHITKQLQQQVTILQTENLLHRQELQPQAKSLPMHPISNNDNNHVMPSMPVKLSNLNRSMKNVTFGSSNPAYLFNDVATPRLSVPSTNNIDDFQQECSQILNSHPLQLDDLEPATMIKMDRSKLKSPSFFREEGGLEIAMDHNMHCNKTSLTQIYLDDMSFHFHDDEEDDDVCSDMDDSVEASMERAYLHELTLSDKWSSLTPSPIVDKKMNANNLKLHSVPYIHLNSHSVVSQKL